MTTAVVSWKESKILVLVLVFVCVTLHRLINSNSYFYLQKVMSICNMNVT